MTFAKRVRDNEVARPNQKSFSLSKWKAAFELDEADQESKNLYEAGKWFFRAFSTIRRNLSFAANKDISKEKKLLAFVGHANLNAVRYQLSIAEIVYESRSLSPAKQSASHILPKVLDRDGASHSLDQVAQSDIDGLQLPLRMILSHNTPHLENPQPHTESQDDIAADYALGIFYKIMENLWDECLWNNYAITESAKGVKFSPVRPADANWKGITLCRRSTVYHATHIHYHSIFERERHLGSHAALGIPRPIIAIEATDRSYTFKLAADDAISEQSRSVYVLIREALQPYHLEYLQFQSPTLAGGTITDVIKCWTVLQSLVFLLQKGAHVLRNQRDYKQALTEITAPRISKSALIETIGESLDISNEISQRLVSFFTYTPSVAHRHEENELWTQPLIALNDCELLPLYTPSEGAIQRNVDIWIRQLGAKLEARGPSFEKHLRDVLSDSINFSPIKNHIALIPHALKFYLPKELKDEPLYEDIDIVLRIGNIVIIGEAKCYLQPVDPDEVFKHREKVIEAQIQLQRKIHYIKKYKEKFRKECVKRGLKLPSNFKIQPLILLNGQIHCGIPYAGTPIVDIAILATFLRGILRQNIVMTIAKGVESADHYRLYSNISEAQERIGAYLLNPPQIQRYANALVEREVIYCNIVNELEPVTYDYSEVDLSKVLE
ncbi:hypothetical protein [Pseudomonas sp. JBR1]|uniref:hypothetical protein n=1 Tax=Pseudomonas sp. JBR1 TaxID=3020907 RepID=UPI00230559CD|nr:hypothetical protein [Pseudomonas sp. JBR1]WCE09022.1 hypothetical protein PJ259_01895 [Pseudomonas sp. JBR1]